MLQFFWLFSVVFWAIDLKFSIGICHDAIQIKLNFSLLTYFFKSHCPLEKFSFTGLFSAVFWDIDLKYGMWTCLNVIKISFDFCRVWYIFTRVISLCSISFPDFSLPSYKILTRNVLYINCLEVIQIKFDFLYFWPTLYESLCFTKIYYSGLFSIVFWNIDLKYGLLPLSWYNTLCFY